MSEGVAPRDEHREQIAAFLADPLGDSGAALDRYDHDETDVRELMDAIGGALIAGGYCPPPTPPRTFDELHAVPTDPTADGKASGRVHQAPPETEAP